MPLPNALHFRRPADKVLLAAWVNMAVTAVVCFAVPDPIGAIVTGSLWVAVFSLLAVIVARRLDKKAYRAEQ